MLKRCYKKIFSRRNLKSDQFSQLCDLTYFHWVKINFFQRHKRVRGFKRQGGSNYFDLIRQGTLDNNEVRFYLLIFNGSAHGNMS